MNKTRKIVKSIVVLVLPSAFEAVIVCVVCNCEVVGAPVISHVVLLSVSPGSAGLAVQEVIVPEKVGVTLVTVAVFTKA